MKKNNDQLLRECIRTILVEQELNEDIMQGYGDSLSDVFLEPFKDAGTIIKGEISKLSTAMGVAVAGVADSVLNLLLPSYESKFKLLRFFFPMFQLTSGMSGPKRKDPIEETTIPGTSL